MIVDWNKETVRRDGYFQALLDVKNWFARHSMSLKNNKMYNQNGIRLILGALADNADYFSEMAEDTEFYYDKENKKMRVVK